MDCYPVQEKGDDEILKSSKPDFIGINYYSSICVKENKEHRINYQLPPFFRSSMFEVCPNEHLKKTNGCLME